MLKMMRKFLLLSCTMKFVQSFGVVPPAAIYKNVIHTNQRNSHTQRQVLLQRGQSSNIMSLLRGTVQNDDEEFVRVPQRRRRERLCVDEDEEDLLDDEDEDDDDEFGIFSNVIIDNPLLDSIDPDGAADRFPELAQDPRFWLDVILFLLFLNWVSSVGPQNYFPDMPYSV